MTLHAGELRHRIAIEQLVDETDTDGDVVQDPETGEIVQEWVEVAKVWAKKVPSSVREFVESSAKQSEVLGRFVIRYRAGITAGMRIVHGTEQFNILGAFADPDSGLEYLTLPYGTGVSDGQ